MLLRLLIVVLLLAVVVLLGPPAGLAAELSPAGRIATGDSADEVIAKLGSRPDRIETVRLLGISYQCMTFRTAGSLITVRFVSDRVIAIETQPSFTIFGKLLD